MTEELCREKFEEWINNETAWPLWRTNYPMIPSEEQQYSDHHTNLAWLAYQAAWNTRAEMEKIE